MRLAPGPIPAVTSDWFDSSTDSPGLSDAAAGASSELDSLELGMDALLSPTAVLDEVIPDLGELAGLDVIDAAVPFASAAIDAGPDAPAIDAQIVTSDVQLVHVYDIVPGEAWGPPLAPLLGYGAPPPPVNPNLSSGAIKNLSNPGSPTLFGVGDRYEWDLSGFVQYGGTIAQGVLVRGFFTKNGAPVLVPWTNMADAQGHVTFTGQWAAADVGHWSGYFDTPGKLSGGQYLLQVPDWDVQLAPVAPVPITGPPGVTLLNTTTPGAQNFKVGDRFALDIFGPPGADVILSIIFNGAQLPPVSIGTIGGAGQLTVYGQFTAAEVGSYIETYIVGGQPLRGTLNFQVS